MGEKWLMRIQLTISEMEEWICLDKKWLMEIQNLMPPPKTEGAPGWKKQDSQGDVCALDAG